MSHRRRFLNLVTANDVVGMYSLRRIDLHARDNSLFYFYPTAAAALDAAAAPEPDSKKKMERIQVPKRRPMLFSGSRLEWFPLSERKLVYLDHDSRAATIYHADERCVDALPGTQAKGSRKFPICFSADGGEGDDMVYFMDIYPNKPGRDDDDEVNSRFQFQALVRREDRWSPSPNNDSSSCNDRWRRDELPPLPYISRAGIDSYGLVGGAGDVLCVSTEGIGTFCFDTASRRWTKAGDWALPFSGKVERVPDDELGGGVLVGFWASEFCGGHRLCAAASGVDLPSPTDNRGRPGVRPTLRSWLVLEPPPCGEEGWVKVRAPQLVSLGSGKFCLAEFFKTTASGVVNDSREEVDDEWFVVLTGVEVVRDGRIRVVKHKSKRYVSNNNNFGCPAMIEFVL